MRLNLSFAVAALLISPIAAQAASAVQKECSAKYQAAKSANTLNGLTYNQYYSQCAKQAREGGGAAPAAPTAATPPAAAPAPTAAPATPPAAAPTQAAAGGAVFPTAIAAEFASLKPHVARMKTCAAQWQKDKADNTTGGMKWNPKGGGYYSECNKRLKG